MDKEQLWKAVLGELEVSLSRANFTTWFRNTSIISIDDDKVIVGVPNVFTKEWLEKKYNQEILEALRHNSSTIKSIEYRIGSIKNLEKELSEKDHIKKVEEEIKHEEEETEVKVALGDLNPKYTFDTFVVGNSNKLAFAACQSVALHLGTKYNPIFIYGGVGLGKTHLMQAVGHAIQEKDKKKNIVYVTSEKFTNDFITSITDKRTNIFKDKYRKADVLMVDDMQFLAGKEQTQEEFFHTFNSLHQANKQIILASDRPPKAIPTLEERLRSRFEWGLIVDIQPPDLETRIAIVQRKAQLRGYVVPLDVCDFIARTIQHNIRELEGALNRILAYCELNGSQPTLDVVKSILNTLINSPRKKSFTPRHIVEKVSDYYDISVNELIGSKRDKEIVMPRQVSMYLMREELHLSYPKIARELGKKDHTTAIHSCDKIEKELEYNEPLRHELSLIKEKIYG
ncbi:MAG: chromosomal replication initiator protein DnaA [Patescibacteria group bacterium]